MSENIKKIGILTSGGDAPGMNAAIRSITRCAIHEGLKVYGIKRGFDGLINTDVRELDRKSVSDTIHRGGTILLTGRSQDMMRPEGVEKAALVCRVLGIDALVVIGGDGSTKGAWELSKHGINTFAIPATIDLDMPCTDYTIGFDTAINTGMDAVNKIRDTSSSHERVSVVEVMGRGAGYIALWCGIAGGAEEVLIPEREEISHDAVIRQIIENRSSGRYHNLILVAEGVGGAESLAREIEKVTGIDARATILGHLQRGGTPTALDRMHATMMGQKAVECIISGEKNKVIISKSGQYASMDFEEAINTHRQYDGKLYDLVKVLAI